MYRHQAAFDQRGMSAIDLADLDRRVGGDDRDRSAIMALDRPPRDVAQQNARLGHAASSL
jgi:hypothetical protein